MQTYTEFLMVKRADEDEETRLKTYAGLREAGDEKVQKALGTMAPGEFGWGLLGAGLGAGGGYVLSRWLRRNGTKRQRAMDMILGALLGGGGTMMLLHALPGKEGFSQAELLRLSNMDKETGGNAGVTMDTDTKIRPVNNTGRWWARGLGALGGGTVGFKLGGAVSDVVGLPDMVGRKYQANTQKSIARQARKAGMSPADYIQANPTAVANTNASMFREGKAIGRSILGAPLGVLGGIFGYKAGDNAYNALSSIKGDVGS